MSAAATCGRQNDEPGEVPSSPSARAGSNSALTESETATTTPLLPGHTLGLRCSVASGYLLERFKLQKHSGCVVLRVSGGAEYAGIRQGDLMIKMGEIPITSGRQFTLLFEEDGEFLGDFTFMRPGEDEPLIIPVQLSAAEATPLEGADPVFYYLRARGYRGELLQQGIKDYSKAIDLEPGFDLAYLYRATLFDDLGAHDRARVDFEKALELTPDLGEAHRWYAQHLMSGSDAAGALSHTRQAIALDECDGAFEKYNVDCSDDYALLSWVLGPSDEDAQESAADHAVRFYPLNEWALYNAACAYASHVGSDAAAKPQAKDYAGQYLQLPFIKLINADPGREKNMQAVADGNGVC